MRKVIALASSFLIFPLLASAQTATSDLAMPPPTAQRFAIVSTTARHGTSIRWTASDGTKMGRESVLLRGLVTETDSASRVGNDGMFDRVIVRGHTSFGDAAETFAINNGMATWKSVVDAGSAAYHRPAEYLSYGGPFDLQADFVEALLASPQKSLAMLPSGQAHAELLTSAFVGEGASKKQVTAYVITGVSNTPYAIWADESGKIFAQIDSLSYIPEGYESAVPMLQKAQSDALALRSRAIAQNFLKKPAGPVAFVKVRAFVDGKRFADNQTVVVDHGLITQVGPSGTINVPKNAHVIDGAGETLVPGLWDAHQHVGGDSTGPELLSLGITSVRDPGNVNILTLSRMARRAKGELLSPHVYPSSLIDGKGPFTAQVGSVATSQEQAIALVRQAKAEGFDAIKIYGSFNPAWVPATTAEAHRLGLHVHGHLPFGMRPAQAIADGYDEITHIFYVIMQAMPDSVVSATGLTRVQGTARYSKDVDLHAEPMKSLIATRRLPVPCPRASSAACAKAAWRFLPALPVPTIARVSPNCRVWWVSCTKRECLSLPERMAMAWSWCASSNSTWAPDFQPPRRLRAPRSCRRIWLAPTNARAPSKSARVPTCCWSMATHKRTSARYARPNW
jgi:hypothetical protein